jgi:hypothetical protein
VVTVRVILLEIWTWTQFLAIVVSKIHSEEQK